MPSNDWVSYVSWTVCLLWALNDYLVCEHLMELAGSHLPLIHFNVRASECTRGFVIDAIEIHVHTIFLLAWAPVICLLPTIVRWLDWLTGLRLGVLTPLFNILHGLIILLCCWRSRHIQPTPQCLLCWNIISKSDPHIVLNNLLWWILSALVQSFAWWCSTFLLLLLAKVPLKPIGKFGLIHYCNLIFSKLVE